MNNKLSESENSFKQILNDIRNINPKAFQFLYKPMNNLISKYRKWLNLYFQLGAFESLIYNKNKTKIISIKNLTIIRIFKSFIKEHL